MVGRTPITGIWKTQMTFEPTDFTSSSTLLLSPLMTEEMVMTVVTPITMPRMVRPERNLVVRGQYGYASAVLFVAQSLDRVEIGCLPCRIDSKNQADAARNHEADHGPDAGHRCGQRRHQ